MVNRTKYNLNNSKSKGFTLIEILVVVFIIALIASVAAINVVSTSALASKITAMRLLQLFQLAEQQAITENQILSFQYNNTGYQFLMLQMQHLPDQYSQLMLQPNLQQNMMKNLQQIQWVPVPFSHDLNYANLPHNVVLTLSINAAAGNADQVPIVIFFPTGELTPFVLDIGVAGKSAQYKIIGDANGTLTLTKVTS